MGEQPSRTRKTTTTTTNDPTVDNGRRCRFWKPGWKHHLATSQQLLLTLSRPYRAVCSVQRAHDGCIRDGRLQGQRDSLKLKHLFCFVTWLQC